MKKKIMEKWVKALRNGKYKQNNEMLKNKSGYCCLGVLCNISKLGKFKENGSIHSFYWGKSLNKEENYHLPCSVRKWAGMQTDTGICIGFENNLVTMNDRGSSFKEIADFIEKNYKNL